MRWWIISRRNFTWNMVLTRTWISEPSLIVWLWGRVTTDSCPLLQLQQLAFSESRHFDLDIFPANTNTVIYERLLHYIVPGTGILWGISSNLALCIHSLRCSTDAPPLQPLSASVVPYFYGFDIDGERALLVSSFAGTGLMHSSVCCYIVWKQGRACIWRLI